VLHKGQSCTESILRCKISNGDVNGLSHHQGLAAVHHAAQAELAALSQRLSLNTKVSCQPALVLGESACGNQNDGNEKWESHHLFFLLRDASVFFGVFFVARPLVFFCVRPTAFFVSFVAFFEGLADFFLLPVALAASLRLGEGAFVPYLFGAFFNGFRMFSTLGDV
jgi:hypothetical protein